MLRIIQIITFSTLMTTTALAQMFDGDDTRGRNFTGIMGGETTVSTNGVPDLKPLTFTALVGHDFDQYFGLELRGGFTGDDEEQGFKIKIPYFGSGLARIGWLPVNGSRFGIYGLVGYTGGEIRAEYKGFTAEKRVGGPSYGVGLDLLATEHSALHVEYIHYLDKEIRSRDVNVSHIGIGYVFRF